MTRSASVLGEDIYANSNEDFGNYDWVSDAEQLANWQEQLVDSCHAISRQLTEIQSDLHRDLNPAVPFRLIKASSIGEEFNLKLACDTAPCGI